MVGIDIPASGRVSGVAVGVADAVDVGLWAITPENSPTKRKSKKSTKSPVNIFNLVFFISFNLLERCVKSKS